MSKEQQLVEAILVHPQLTRTLLATAVHHIRCENQFSELDYYFRSDHRSLDEALEYLRENYESTPQVGDTITAQIWDGAPFTGRILQVNDDTYVVDRSPGPVLVFKTEVL